MDVSSWREGGGSLVRAEGSEREGGEEGYWGTR